MDVEKLLQQVKDGKVSIREAAQDLKKLPYEDLGYAKVDHHRRLRTGAAEVVFCQGKADSHLCGIFENFYENRRNVLGTRASAGQYEMLHKKFPELRYDPVARIVKAEFEERELQGNVAVCTAGTADIPVAEEAALTAQVHGNEVVRLYDVGVAGLHRLLACMDDIMDASVIIAVAGMEGALASVIGGLADCPVIAVPTSVGYGASFQGVSALLSMLNSCASGVSVVNIDNGYGAGDLASRINHMEAH